MADTGALGDDLAALQAIEHARHAAILPRLRASTRGTLLAAAERFGLTDFLLDGVTLPAPPPVPPTEVDLIARAQDAFTGSMRQTTRRRSDRRDACGTDGALPDAEQRGDLIDC